MKRLVAIVVMMGIAGYSSNAWAEMATSDDACGCTSYGYQLDTPNGALILTRGDDGMISEVITAIDEFYTHSVLSHGNGWFSHSTMYTPGTDLWGGTIGCLFGGCQWIEEDQLEQGYPGFSQVTRAGMMHYLNGSGTVRWYSGGTAGSGTTNYLWNSSPYQGEWSQDDDDYWIYRVGFNDRDGNFRAKPYVLYQYMDIQGTWLHGKSKWDGSVCSTSIAYALNRAYPGPNEYNNFGGSYENNCPASYYNDGWCDRGCQWADVDCTKGDAEYVVPKTYTNAQITDGAWALYYGAKSACEEQAPWGCGDSANQVVNCMARADCDNTGDGWKDVLATGATAYSISPDRLVKYSGSPWYGATPNTITKSSGGTVCGCWF